jgi:hypothetical protein
VEELGGADGAVEDPSSNVEVDSFGPGAGADPERDSATRPVLLGCDDAVTSPRDGSIGPPDGVGGTPSMLGTAPRARWPRCTEWRVDRQGPNMLGRQMSLMERMMGEHPGREQLCHATNRNPAEPAYAHQKHVEN